VRLRDTHLVVSVLIVLMLSACLVPAQEEPAKPLTLEEAVSLARSHNRELKQAGLEIHKQKEAFTEAKTQLSECPGSTRTCNPSVNSCGA
jgi:hypothetical protein